MTSFYTPPNPTSPARRGTRERLRGRCLQAQKFQSQVGYADGHQYNLYSSALISGIKLTAPKIWPGIQGGHGTQWEACHTAFACVSWLTALLVDWGNRPPGLQKARGFVYHSSVQPQLQQYIQFEVSGKNVKQHYQHRTKNQDLYQMNEKVHEGDSSPPYRQLGISNKCQ